MKQSIHWPTFLRYWLLLILAVGGLIWLGNYLADRHRNQKPDERFMEQFIQDINHEENPMSMTDYTAVALAENQPVGQASASLGKVIFMGLIGTQVSYLEHQIGPQKEILWGENALYELDDGCELEVYASDGEITAFAVPVNALCSFDLGGLVMGGKTQAAYPLRFGDVPLQPALYYADCLYGCGNAYDLSTYLHWEGPRAFGFMEVMVSSTAITSLSDQWKKEMLKNEGEDWVMDQQYNCDPSRYRDLAEMTLSLTLVEKIYVGYDLLNLRGLKSACVS